MVVLDVLTIVCILIPLLLFYPNKIKERSISIS
jgi:hypothetical protein